MIPFISLLKNDARLYLKDWKALVLLLAAPVLFISFFLYALTPYLNKSSFIEPFPVALVDLENTAQTRMVAKQLEEIGIFSEIVLTDERTAREKLSDGKVGGIIIIPPDLTSSIASGENKPVIVIGSSAMPLKAYIVKNIVQSAANLISAAQSAVIAIYRYDMKAGVSGEELETRYNGAAMDYIMEVLARNRMFMEIDSKSLYSLTPAEYFTAALFVVFMMFAGMPGMKAIVVERREGITRRLCAAPVRIWQVILSKLIASTFVLILQSAAVILLTAKLFNNYWGTPVRNTLILFGGIIVAVSGWSALVAGISSSPASADVIGNLGILLMSVAGGSIYPLSSMPKWVRHASELTINRWAMEGFMALFSGNPSADTGIYALILVAIGIAMFVAALLAMKMTKMAQPK